MYDVDILTLKLYIFILVLNRTTDKWANQEVKVQLQNEIEILFCSPVFCIILHFSGKYMKKCIWYNPGHFFSLTTT